MVFIAERVMGWNVFGLERHGYDSGPAYETTRLIENVENNWIVFAPGKDASHPRIWNPLTSIADAFEVEEEIQEEKRALYAHLLSELIRGEFGGTVDESLA